MATVLARGQVASMVCSCSSKVPQSNAGRTNLNSSFLRVEPTSSLSSLNSSIQGQVCVDSSMFRRSGVEMQKGRMTTCMAWGGTLASVRLIIQGKHLEVKEIIILHSIVYSVHR